MIVLQITETELSAMVKQAVIQALAESNHAPQPVTAHCKPITTKELCSYLAITPQTVIRWKRKGKIPFFTIGTAVRFNLDEVVRALSDSGKTKRG